MNTNKIDILLTVGGYITLKSAKDISAAKHVVTDNVAHWVTLNRTEVGSLVSFLTMPGSDEAELALAHTLADQLARF